MNKRAKKLVSMVLAMCMLAAFLPLTTNAYDTYEGWKYSVVNGDTVTIHGYTDETVTTLEIPSEIDGIPVTRIWQNAFHNYQDLTSVTIPDSVTKIEHDAFSYCSDLENVKMSQSVETIGYQAFAECSSLTTLTLPDTLTAIDSNAFFNCDALASVVLGNGLQSIGNWAFYGCWHLKNLTIPESVTAIGSYAFLSCSDLESVTIPKNVTSIGIGAFAAYLTSITVDSDNVAYCSEDGNLFSKDKTTLVQYATGKTDTAYAIPDGVTNINSYAFYQCDNLTEITVPESVTTIGSYSFSDCEKLTSVTIPNSVTSIGSYSFRGCKKLTSVTLPEGITSIERYMFSDCFALENITIPQSVTAIGSHAFDGCSKLANITLPDNVVSVGFSAFDDTAYYNNADNWDNGALYMNKCLIKANADQIGTEYSIKDGTKTIADNAFFFCGELTDVTIPESVLGIGDTAFGGCGITSITIPDGVTIINDSTFMGCLSLTSVTLPESVRDIASTAFFGCSLLTDINIPSSVTSIGYRAFYDCESLDSITLPENISSIGASAFFDTAYYNNAENWENGALYNGKYLLESNYSQTGSECIVKDGTKIIADSAFFACEFTSIAIPKSVISIGGGAFEQCDELTDVYYDGTASQWEAINIEEYNDELLNAQIYYENVIPTPTPTPTPTPSYDKPNFSIAYNVLGDDIGFIIRSLDESKNSELEDIKLFVAEYDENGVLTALYFGTNEKALDNIMSITAPVPQTNNYKILLWDKNQCPLMDAITDIN